MALQETHSSSKIQKIWKSQWGGQIFYDHGTSNSRGVAILIRKGYVTKVHRMIQSGVGRYLLLDITVDNRRLTVCNIYAPNTDSPEFFNDVFQKITILDNQDVIIAGDFNTILCEIDRKGGSN